MSVRLADPLPKKPKVTPHTEGNVLSSLQNDTETHYETRDDPNAKEDGSVSPLTKESNNPPHMIGAQQTDQLQMPPINPFIHSQYDSTLLRHPPQENILPSLQTLPFLSFQPTLPSLMPLHYGHDAQSRPPFDLVIPNQAQYPNSYINTENQSIGTQNPPYNPFSFSSPETNPQSMVDPTNTPISITKTTNTSTNTADPTRAHNPIALSSRLLELLNGRDYTTTTLERRGNSLFHVVDASEGRFILKAHPNYSQRKSYDKEIRYITPNPLVIVENIKLEGNESILPAIVNGRVEVSLVPEHLQSLPENMMDMLQSAKTTTEQQLAVIEGFPVSCEFSLKLVRYSGDLLLRLQFFIYYSTNDNIESEQIIFSRPFRVESNKKIISRETPKLTNLMPKEGEAKHKTEVWLKGSNFYLKDVVVAFDNKEAKVTEVSSNLISVYAPARLDLKESKTVNVTVANRYNTKYKKADQTLQFKYKV